MQPSEMSFRKSSHSATQNDCVEVADLPTGGAAVRDTKHHDHGHIAFEERQEWAAFLAIARHG